MALLGPDCTDTLQDDWTLVGYDVTSCYSESMISARFGPRIKRGEACECEDDLNEHLLFSELTRADRFRRAQDAAHDRESPHMIYGIWRVAETAL